MARPNPRSLPLAVAVALGGAAFAIPVLAATDFELTLETSVSYTDNLELTHDSLPKESDFIAQLAPAISLTQESSRWDATLNYRLQNLYYLDSSELNESFHQAQLNSDLLVLPEWFSINVQSALGQRLVEPQRALNFENLFPTASVTDEFSGSVTPLLQHEFGRIAARAAYTYGVVNYAGTPDSFLEIDDSTSDTIFFELAPAEDDPRIEWGLDYRSESVDYDNSFPYEYERASATIGVPVSRSVWVLANGGAESDVSESTLEGGLDSSFWRGGLRFGRDPENRLEVWYGQRFFGDAYEARLTRRARLLRIALSYSEEPETETGRLTRRDLLPGQETVLDPTLAIVRPVAEPYLLKYFNASVSLEGRVTTITLNAFQYDQEYLRTQRGEKNEGLGLSIERRLGPRMNVTLSAVRIETNFADTFDETDTDTTVTLALAKTVTQTLTINGRILHLDRKGPTSGEYDALVATVGVVKTF